MNRRKKGVAITQLGALVTILAAATAMTSGSLGIYRHYLIVPVLILEAILLIVLLRIKRSVHHES